MSLDHEDTERIEYIEETTRKLFEKVSRLHNRICNIEYRLDSIDEVKKERIGDIETQMNEMINKLPIPVKGMMKKLVESKEKESE